MKNRQRPPFKTRLVSGVSLAPEGIGTTTSGASYSRFTQMVHMGKPFILESVIWAIDATRTYNLEIVDSVVASPTILKTLVSGLSLNAGNQTFTLSEPYFIKPGIFHLSLYATSPVNMIRRTINPNPCSNVYVLGNVGYDGGFNLTGTVPIWLNGSYYDCVGDV